jgi:hypothetical protein
LSDDAKKFLIAREIFRGQRSPHIIESAFPVIVLGVSAPVFAGAGHVLKKLPPLLRDVIQNPVVTCEVNFFCWPNFKNIC